MFCLFYDAKTKKVSAMNGSGRSGSKVTLEQIKKDLKIPDGENGQIPMDSVHAATVPGAAAGWVDCHERFGSGKLSMEEILAPAIDLAENGFPVSELSATFVSSCDSHAKTEANHSIVGAKRVSTKKSFTKRA
jgi:gamma-glutamyltranspeptidase/glutathione hydrolase